MTLVYSLIQRSFVVVQGCTSACVLTLCQGGTAVSQHFSTTHSVVCSNLTPTTFQCSLFWSDTNDISARDRCGANASWVSLPGYATQSTTVHGEFFMPNLPQYMVSCSHPTYHSTWWVVHTQPTTVHGELFTPNLPQYMVSYSHPT